MYVCALRLPRLAGRRRAQRKAYTGTITTFDGCNLGITFDDKVEVGFTVTCCDGNGLPVQATPDATSFRTTRQPNCFDLELPWPILILPATDFLNQNTSSEYLATLSPGKKQKKQADAELPQAEPVQQADAEQADAELPQVAEPAAEPVQDPDAAEPVQQADAARPQVAVPAADGRQLGTPAKRKRGVYKLGERKGGALAEPAPQVNYASVCR